MKMPDGTSVPPLDKKFKVDFCTVVRRNKNGQLVEENLFYDLIGMLRQIGVLPGAEQQKTAWRCIRSGWNNRLELLNIFSLFYR